MRNTPATVPTALTVSWLLCFAAAACQQQSAREESSSTTVAAAKSEGSAASEGADPCPKLAAQVCKEVGEESPICESTKNSFELLSDQACRAGLQDFAATREKLKKQGGKCQELVSKLCAGVGPDTESCRVVKEKSQGFPPAQCVQMLAHVDEIVAELQTQERANQPLDSVQQAKVAAGNAPAFGPADAKVILVEFSDFECPYCSRAASVTSQIKEKYGDKVRFVFRQYPLSFHQNAEVAARASLAAHAQGKFWPFHDKLFQNQGRLDRASLDGYATELGLDMVKFRAAVEGEESAKLVKQDVALGTEVAVEGTPTLFVNGKRIANPSDFAEVSQAIEAAFGS